MVDSWLLDGNCSTCRRQKYCNTECKLHRISRENHLYATAMSVTGMDRVLGAMSRVDSNVCKVLRTPLIISGKITKSL